MYELKDKINTEDNSKLVAKTKLKQQDWGHNYEYFNQRFY